MWYENEKIKCVKVQLEETEATWCYSNVELEELLNSICKGQRIHKVYVDLYSYLESFYHDKNYFSFAYLGGPVLIMFEKTAVMFYIHAEGLILYRLINLWDMKIREIFDFPVADVCRETDLYYDLCDQFSLKFTDRTVNSVVFFCG